MATHKMTLYIPSDSDETGVSVVERVTKALAADAISCAVAWEALVPFDMRDLSR